MNGLKFCIFQQLGNLTIDTKTKFEVKGGDKNKGFKFELTTGKRLNTFKVCLIVLSMSWITSIARLHLRPGNT